ncbi:plexin domain-containing protein 2 [Cimex lectularius]|uniref:PSI domain-containing protein n=1 Tax=Cimex lectularius TaxID=79782 RepID=A0A8I6RFY0_CIMLE|nr:plexin domain-containing protein 2 [Cimex lectularius]
MAFIVRLSTLTVLTALLTQCLSVDDGYYSYTVARCKSDDFRLKRYVDSPIPRLASNYHSHMRMLKDASGLDSKLKPPMVMTGNMAVTMQAAKTTTPPKHSESTTNLSSTASSSDTPGVTEDYPPMDGYPRDVSNNNATLEKNNITRKQTDEHLYYNSTLYIDDKLSKHYWVDMDNKEEDVIVNEMLSNSHRRAVTVKLKFDFPFYGHYVRNISIATGGFIYTGDYIHSWLAATQYIAPLMANFATNLTKDSYVKYRDNGTAFTVEWERVWLLDLKQAGPFTFQVTLLDNGDIIFVYKDIPISVNSIHDKQHPVKVGLSDAYIIDHNTITARKKIIYEYHQVNFKGPEIKNWTVIYINALLTCHSLTSCLACTSVKTGFDCKWCPELNRCSTGFDRKRQEWERKRCDSHAIQNPSACMKKKSKLVHLMPQNTNSSSVQEEDVQHVLKLANVIAHPQNENEPKLANVIAHPQNQHVQKLANVITHPQNNQNDKEESTSMVHTGLLGTLFFMLLTLGGAVWVVYAYRNPHTQSGQFLIKYRPSQWTRRRGEARYTAASIHM